jgi:hypothetical protein
MLRFGPALYVLLLTASLVEAQELTPSEMEGLIKTLFASCVRLQLNNPQNAGVDHALVQEYCRCVAHRFAARTTRAEIASFERSDKLLDAPMIAKMQKLGQECAAEIQR